MCLSLGCVSGVCEPFNKFSPGRELQVLSHDAFLKLEVKALAGLTMLLRPLTLIKMDVETWLRFDRKLVLSEGGCSAAPECCSRDTQVLAGFSVVCWHELWGTSRAVRAAQSRMQQRLPYPLALLFLSCPSGRPASTGAVRGCRCFSVFWSYEAAELQADACAASFPWTRLRGPCRGPQGLLPYLHPCCCVFTLAELGL